MADTSIRLITSAKTKLQSAINRIVNKDFTVDRNDKDAIARLMQDATHDYCTLDQLRKDLEAQLRDFRDGIDRIDDETKKNEVLTKYQSIEQEVTVLADKAQDNLIVLASTERGLMLALDALNDQPPRSTELKEEPPEHTTPEVKKLNQTTTEEERTATPHTPGLITNNIGSESPSHADPPSHLVPTGVTTTTAVIAPRLPRLQVPTFDGTGEWRQFWARFKITVESQALTKTDKLVYLMGALQGDALELVRGYSVSEASYDHVVKTLEEEYGDHGLQITRLLSAFHDIAKARETTTSAHKTVQEMQRITRQLSALGESINNSYLETAMHKKLPGFLLERVLREKSKRGTFTVTCQLEFLTEEVTILRRMEELEGSKKTVVVSNAALVKAKSSSSGLRRPPFPCRFCEEMHLMYLCPLSILERLKAVVEKKLCHGCLRPGHRLTECNFKRPCRHCSKSDHHSAICQSSTRDKPWTSTTTSVIDGAESEVILLTHNVKLINPQNGSDMWTSVFLDNGAQRSFINQDLAKELRLVPIDQNAMEITTFGNHRDSFVSFVYHVKLQQMDGGFMDLRVCSTPCMEMLISGISPNDHEKKRPTRCNVIPGLLIGSDRFWDVIDSKGPVLPSGLRSIKTVFGRMVTGPTVMASVQTRRLDRKSRDSEETKEMNDTLKKFFTLEAVGVTDDPHQQDDEITQAHFEKTVKRAADGRYVTRLPYKSELPNVADNRGLSMGRLTSVWKRLREIGRLEDYDKIIKEQLEDGILEEVVEEGNHTGVISYLPHHPVINEAKKSTKLRIVFDASAGPRGRSLNKSLYQGDVHMPHAAAMLLRMRSKKIVVTADIKKAFLQVGLHEDDRDALRLIWVKDPALPPTNDNIIVLRFTRVPFGVICSPFLLSATIRKHLEDEKTPMADELSTNLYADNLMFGVETAEEARTKIEMTKEIFERARMPLREWTCNEKSVHKEYSDEPEENRTTFLGVGWDVASDQLGVRTFSSTGKLLTKRTVLSETMATFDPMGWISPAVLPARRFMQKISSYEWDATLSEDDQKEWLAITSELTDREVLIDRQTPVSNAQLHVFTDASGCVGYGAAVYLRSHTDKGIETFLLMAKSKVCPSSESTAVEKEMSKPTDKRITVPRLELLAADIGSRLVAYVKKELGYEIEKTILWTDSLPALSQIMQPEKEHKKFVANRVEKINNQGVDEFRYVPTYDNPADVASRGCSFDDLKANVLWWKGPSWLRKKEDEWPITPHGYTMRTLDGQEEEVATEVVATVVVKEQKPYKPFIDMSRFSKYTRLEGVAGWILRFVRRLAARSGVKTTTDYLQPHAEEWEKRILTPEERYHATRMLISESVKEFPPTEDIIRNFGLRHDGTAWRVYGRLTNSPSVKQSGCPYFLDPKSLLAHLVTHKAHTDLHHCGEKDTLANLRRTFWIPRAGRLAKRVIGRCMKCKREKAKPFSLPSMPPLPEHRVTRTRPFDNVGVDYLGPVAVTSSRGKKKTWISLWTCMSTRAIHLELVGDLSTASFLLAMRRFIARRGRPSFILSDHGTNFVGAEKSLSAWKEVITDDNIISYASKEKIEWKMITPRAPWKGGFYERMVGMVKTSFSRATVGTTLTSAELHTVITEVEAVVNSRPLVQVTDDGLTLRPVDFLSPLSLVGIPPRPSNYGYGVDDLRDLWFTTTHVIDDFWDHWQAHYLPSLRDIHRSDHRQPRSRHGRQPRLGEVVLVADRMLPRGCWTLATIEKVIISKEGVVRAAKVRMPNRRIVERAINHLFPLEVNNEETSTEAIPESVQEGQETIANNQIREEGRGRERKRRAPPIEESTRHHYNLRSTTKTALALMMICTLFTPSKAAQCINNTAPPQSDLVYAEDCAFGGGILVYNVSKSFCFVQKPCKKGSHLRVFSPTNVSCGVPCSCPEWSSGCSHYVGEETLSSAFTIPSVTEILGRLAPKDVCAYEQKDDCGATPRKRWMSKIELYDGSVHPIADLHLQYRNPLSPICIGDGFTATGTALFCARNRCVVNATSFCTHERHEAVYLKDGSGHQVLVKAWGGGFMDLYPFKITPRARMSATVECSTGGVLVKMEGAPRLLEVCSRNHCDRTERPKETEEVVLPHVITISPFHAQITLYKETQIEITEIDCPAGAFCEQIGCLFCWEMLTNMHCAPRTLLVIFAIFLYFFTSFIAIMANCCILCSGAHTIICWVWRIIIALMRWCWRRRPGRPDRRLIEETPRRPNQATVRGLRWSGLVAMCVIISLNGAAACQRTSVVVAKEEVCARKNGDMQCRIDETVQWPSITPGEKICLQITDNIMRPMATVEFSVLEIILECQREFRFFTYNYRPAVASSKRCPGMGSCSGTKCSEFKKEDWIPELGESQAHPGTTNCVESCGCAGCGCFFCSAACLFYRQHAVIDKDHRFEVFTCPSWKQIVKLEVKKTQPAFIQEYNISLAAGQVETRDELRLHVTRIAAPPLPMLTAAFITDGRTTAIVDNMDDIDCLQCNSDDTCMYKKECCSCTTYDELARCSCSSGTTAEDRLKQAALPQQWQEQWITIENGRVAVKSPASAMEMQATIDQWNLTPVEELSTCKMKQANVSGCHSCRRGATINYECESNVEHAIGHVVCDGGLTFNVECSTNAPHRTTTLSFDRTRLDVNCELRCGIASEDFHLTADLALVSIVGEMAVDAKQSIPVIVKNLVDLSLSSYEYLFIIIIVIVFLFLITRRGSRKKFD